eukprot:13927827-Heterocapsa_arctica.AAC.1
MQTRYAHSCTLFTLPELLLLCTTPVLPAARALARICYDAFARLKQFALAKVRPRQQASQARREGNSGEARQPGSPPAPAGGFGRAARYF